MAETTGTEVRTIRPVGDICEERDAVVLRLEMPGVGKEGLELSIDGECLTVNGRRRGYAEDVNYLVRERRTGDYRAVYTLDQRVDRGRIDARIEQGVLTVKLHLKDEVKPRKIEVKSE